MSKLNGKVAIVTGASKGIGASIAVAFGAAGAAVAVNYNADKAGAEHVVDVIKAAGGKAIAVQGDVANPADIERLFADTREAFGALNVLVNNAGVFHFEPLEAVTAAEFHRQFNTNVLAPILTTQTALKYFGAGGGSVINISSTVVGRPLPNSTVYSASKGALDVVTRSLAIDLGARNIRVNAIAPGGVDTEGTRRIGFVGSEAADQLVAVTPLGRFGQPDDIARVALFLASDDAAWVTGEVINASGGLR